MGVQLGLIKNKKLARSIADSSWGMFLRILSYKGRWHGKNVLTIGRFVASSKTCHVCGLSHDRDINAAKVIKKQAIADAFGQSVCVKSSSVTIPVSTGVAARE